MKNRCNFTPQQFSLCMWMCVCMCLLPCRSEVNECQIFESVTQRENLIMRNRAMTYNTYYLYATPVWSSTARVIFYCFHLWFVSLSFEILFFLSEPRGERGDWGRHRCQQIRDQLSLRNRPQEELVCELWGEKDNDDIIPHKQCNVALLSLVLL